MSLLAVAVWAAITVFGGLLQTGQGAQGTLVTQNVVASTPLAAAFMLIVIWLMGWKDVGLNAPRPPSSSWLLWPVAIYVAIFASVAAMLNKIPAEVLAIVALNTAFVGFSEELAFRGVLWGAARRAMSFWPAVLMVSALFGSVHLMNVFITGHLGEASVQSLNAALSGLGYLALRIRTRSLVTVMIGHWLWDLSVFLSAPNAGAAAADPAKLLVGAALVAPLALYGLWLLRKKEYQLVTDDGALTARTAQA